MQLYQLKPTHKSKLRKRIGRGGKRGTFSGKGVKGQKSRSGKSPRPGFAGGNDPFYKRFPKQRGLHGSKKIRRGVKLLRLRQKSIVLNLKDIAKKFKEDEVVSPKTLLKKGIIARISGRIPRVKILGSGELDKKLIFQGVSMSQSAKTKTGFKEEKKIIVKKPSKKKEAKQLSPKPKKIIRTKTKKTKLKK